MTTTPPQSGPATSDHERTLEKQAREYLRRRRDEDNSSPAEFIIADFEYRYRRQAHADWSYTRGPDEDGDGKKQANKIRWPFHSIAAACWLVLRFNPGADVPLVTGPVVMTLDEHEEAAIVDAFFKALDGAWETSRLVTWGGEARDHSVLRHQASRHGLVLPMHLRDTAPYARERIDLCRSTSVQAHDVHLDEYAAGSGIPAKPSPPRAIGKLVEAGKWDLVRDHNLADVMTTSVIALRWLAAMGEIRCDRERSGVAISDAALAAYPDSQFLTRDFRPWARDRLRAAGMGGTVYRMPEAA